VQSAYRISLIAEKDCLQKSSKKISDGYIQGLFFQHSENFTEKQIASYINRIVSARNSRECLEVLGEILK
jgi:hypothetical protein